MPNIMNDYIRGFKIDNTYGIICKTETHYDLVFFSHNFTSF